MHLLLAVASLAFIGFVSMLTDMMLMTIAYSVYLYPKNSVCMLYLLLLVIGITWEVGDAFRTDLNKNGLQRTAKIVTAGIYGVQIFYTGIAWYNFCRNAEDNWRDNYKKKYSEGEISDVERWADEPTHGEIARACYNSKKPHEDPVFPANK
jgi:hypothetical protein